MTLKEKILTILPISAFIIVLIAFIFTLGFIKYKGYEKKYEKAQTDYYVVAKIEIKDNDIVAYYYNKGEFIKVNVDEVVIEYSGSQHMVLSMIRKEKVSFVEYIIQKMKQGDEKIIYKALIEMRG